MVARALEEFLRCRAQPLGIGDETEALERELAAWFGALDCVVVSSGTAAIHTALAALGIGPGDEVLVPTLSVVMSVVPVLYVGATPVFVDSQPDCVDFDYDDLAAKVSARTRAIIPVYLWGCAYDLPRLRGFAAERGIHLVEDACQAHGSRYDDKHLGTWGACGCFSMKDGKLLSSGEGGFVLTSEPSLAEMARSFRNHHLGTRGPEAAYARLGWNYRLSEVQALLARARLAELPATCNHRRWQAGYVLDALAGVPELKRYAYRDCEEPNRFCAVLLTKNGVDGRAASEELARMGVVNSVGTFGLRPAHTRGVFSRATAGDDSAYGVTWRTPNAERFLRRVLALVLLPHYTATDLDDIVAKVKTVSAQHLQ